MDQTIPSPLTDDSTGTTALSIITPIFALGILFYALRIYTRVIPTYKLNASDYTCTIAVVSARTSIEER